MKNTKRLLSAVLVLVVMVACMLVITSCNKDEHEHSYTETVTPPTCTSQGFTTHTCECGDSYVDSYVPAGHTMSPHAAKAPTCTEVGHTAYVGCDGCGEKEGYVEIPKIPHNLVAEITEYPSVAKAGTKKLSCTACSYTETQAIAAFTASLPNVSAVLGSAIEEGKYTLGMKEGSTLILVKELSEYDPDADLTGEKVFIAFNLAKAEIASKDSLVQGYLKLEFGTATKIIDGTVSADEITAPDEFDSAGAIEIYLNGDDVSVSVVFDGVTNVEEELSINDTFYNALAEMMGMTYDELVTAIYLGGKVQNVVPSATAIITALQSIELPEITDEYKTSVQALFALVGENIITAETDADGNIVYSVDVEALVKLVEAIEDKTVLEFLSEAYGATTVNNLMTFIASIPDMTVMDITNRISSIAVMLGIDAAEAYELIDMLVYFASETEISIQAELVKNYNKTIAEIVADNAVAANPNINRDDIIASFKANINTAVATISNLTFDDIYNMYAAQSGIELEKDFSLTANLKAMIAGLSDVITAEVVVDAEGNLVSLEATLPNGVITVGYEEAGLVASVTFDEDVVEVTLSDNAINVDLITGEVTIANISLTYENTVELEVVTETYTFTVTAGTDVLVDASVTIVDKVFSGATLVINGYESATDNDATVDNNTEGENTEVINNTEENVEESTLVNYVDISVDYVVDAEVAGKMLTINVNGIDYVVEVRNNSTQNGIVFTVEAGDEVLLGIAVQKMTQVVDEVTHDTYIFVVADNENTLFRVIAGFENGAFVGANAEMNVYETVTDEETKETAQILKNVFTANASHNDNGEGTKITNIVFNGYSVVIESVETADNSTLNVDVMADGDVIANVSASSKTESVTEGETTTTTNTFTFDVTFGEDVLVDLDATAVNGGLTDANILVNFYYTALEDVYDTETGEIIGTNEVLTLDTLLDATIAIDGNVITVDDEVSGDTAKIELLDNGLKITVNETVVLATVTETVENDVVTGFEFSFNVTDGTDVLLNYVVKTENGMVTDVVVFAQDYQTYTAIDGVTGMPVGDPVRVFTTLIDYKYNVTFTESGLEIYYYYADDDLVYYDLTYGIGATENGLTLSYDIDTLLVSVSYSSTSDSALGDGEVTGPLVSTVSDDNGDDTSDGIIVEEYEGDIMGGIVVYTTATYISIEGEGEITFTYEPVA